ncbi:MAG: DUF5362 family protein [Ilyomonas sp.]
MEQTTQPLFELQIDPQGQQYLYNTAKWSKFLSIVGFIFIGFFIVVALFIGAIFNTISSQSTNVMPAYFNGATLSFIYIIIALIYFFPCLHLYRFSSRMLNALSASDQATLNSSLSQLKAFFKFMGVLTIVVLSLYVLGMISAIFVGSMFMQS